MQDHGTRARYQAGCHCDECTEANRLYITERRREAGMQPMKRGRTHGYSGYLGGHRCDECRAGYAEYRREKRRQAKSA